MNRVVSWSSSSMKRFGGARIPSIVHIHDGMSPVRLFASTSKFRSKSNKGSRYSYKPNPPAVQQPGPPLTLLSLSTSSTVEDVIENLKRLRKIKSYKKYNEVLENAGNLKLFNLNVTTEALKTLQIMNKSENAPQVYQSFLEFNSGIVEKSLISQPSATGFLVKWFSRIGNMDIVEDIFQKIRLQLFPNDLTNSCISAVLSQMNNANADVRQYYFLYYSDLLIQATMGFATARKFKKALNCLETMAYHNMSIDLESSRSILKLFVKESNTHQSLDATRLLLALDGIYDKDSLQIAVNTFVRNIEFTKGSVSMESLPPEEYGEVAFIGRSNVGKSSLINAITNRKNLAYTSKSAGKTSEFNYFLVSGVVGVMKEEPKFYLIDLPGVGFAKRSKSTRTAWTTLMDQFSRERSTLRCIFHLIDSRHGALEADDECFQLLENLPDRVQYVIVFTKVDKLRASESKSLTDGGELPIAAAMYEDLQRKVRHYTKRDIPVLFSSAETKSGALSVLYTALNSVSDLSLPVMDSTEESNSPV